MYVVEGTTYIASARIGGGQGANGNKEIVLDIHLPDISGREGRHRRCTCSVVTLNSTHGCSRTWMLATRISKILGSLEWGHTNNTNVGSSSGHVGENAGRLEVVWQGNIDCNALNEMKHEGFDGTVISTMKVPNKTLQKVSITQEDATEVHHMKIVRPILAVLKKRVAALLFGHGNINVALDETSGLVSSLSPRPVPLIVNAW